MRGRLSIWALCPLVLALVGLAACGGGSGGGGADSGLTVDAGADVQMSEGTLVTLTATPADPAATYLWTQISGPTVVLSGETTSTCTFTAPQLPSGQVEELVFSCAVSLGGESSSDTVTVQVGSLDYVVFTRGTDTEPRHFYRVEVGSGSETQLSHDTATGASIANERLSPDGQYVMYQVDGDTPGQIEVWVARTDGSGAVKVSGALPVFSDAFTGAWSPDSSRLYFEADTTFDDVYELFTVRPDGTGLNRCHAPSVAGDDIRIVRWSPDSSRIAFTAELGGNTDRRLYVALADGTGTQQLSKAPPAGTPRGAGSFEWSPNSQFIAYRGDLNVEDVDELFVVAATGGISTTLNGTLVSGGEVESIVGWSPDNSTVLYTADEDTVGLEELYAVTGALARTKLSAPMVAGARGITGFPRIAPDGSRVFYYADVLTVGTYELFSVRLNGTSGRRVTPALTGNASLSLFFQWLPDSSGILYRYTPDDTVTQEELWVADPLGATRTKISAAGSPNEVVQNAVFSPDGQTVAWVQLDISTGASALWSAKLDGTDRKQLSPFPTLPTRTATQPLPVFSPDGASILYATVTFGGPVPGPDDVFVVRADGSGNRSVVGTASGTIDIGTRLQWLP